MSRLGAILYIDIVVPEPTTVNSLVISCDEEIFTEKADLDISGEEAAVTSKKMTNTLNLEFKNTTTTTANETVRGYMAVFPVDFSDKTVYATLKTEAGLFGAAVQSRVVNKGKAAFLRFSDSFISQSGEDNGHEYIEMAPGFYWATCNVGADNPWDYGDYFSWGETEARDFTYNWDDYKWSTSSGTYTKYVTDESSGTIDNLTTLLPADDAATANWHGNWRMPTDAEWTALRNTDNFTWKWTDNYNESGVAGYTVTSKVPRYFGNQIFLPAAGARSDTFISKGSGGTYWSSSLNTGHSSTACNVDFWISESTGAQYIRNVNSRVYVKSVRPVYAPEEEGIAIPEAIDLGLPSGLKWASFNLGASAPEEFGDYYAWGETEPYFSRNPMTWKEGKEEGYTWTSYKWCMGSNTTMTKYCTNSSYGYNGFTDDKTVLDPEDDAAHVNLGGKWRMPTVADWEELFENCTCTWDTRNGLCLGITMSSKTNNNSIYLPASGYCSASSTPTPNSGYRIGYYRTSTLDVDNPYRSWIKRFDSDKVSEASHNRYLGYSIRPVYDEK